VQSAPFLGSAPNRAQRFGTCFFHKSPFDTNHAFLQRHRETTLPDPCCTLPGSRLVPSCVLCVCDLGKILQTTSRTRRAAIEIRDRY
jgi:hypothetical protein